MRKSNYVNKRITKVKVINENELLKSIQTVKGFSSYLNRKLQHN